jgi:anti-sigma B factor antagonist
MSLRLVVPGSTGNANAPPYAAFACSWSWAHGGHSAATVRVSGELDIATAPRLEQTLDESLLEARRVVIDLHECAFIDSAGVHAIVDASVRARQDGRLLVLVRVPPHVHRVVALTGNSDHVEIGNDAVAPPRRPRLKSATVPLRAVSEPESIEPETYDRLLRAIVDREDSRPR